MALLTLHWFNSPPPSFPNPTTPVDLMTKEWYWEGVKKNGTAGNETVF